MTIAEHADTALLVNNAHPMRGRLTLRLSSTWRGPKHGKTHAPREYRWTRVQIAGTWWKVGAMHGPFGQAQKAESLAAVGRWFAKTFPGRPTVMVGDWNMRNAILNKRLPSKLLIEVAGNGIDLTAYRHCRLIRVQSLEYYGSDHRAVLYEFLDPKTNTRLVVLAWNVRVTQDPGHVRNVVAKLARDHKPDVIALNEAYRLKGHLGGLGYRVIHRGGK